MSSFWKVRTGSLMLVLAACGSEPPTVERVGLSDAKATSLVQAEFSEWSEPERLDISSSPTADITPAISTNGLALYFASNRPGGVGSNDLWVSRRANANDAWGVPENLGPPVNSVALEVGPSLSVDGQFLYFSSSRPSSADEVGACGGGAATPMAHCDNDIWESRRECAAAPCEWGAPANLGPGVNTPLFEGGQGVWGTHLYFNRGSTANPLAGAPDPGPLGDIFASQLELGVVPGEGASFRFGTAVAVAELNSAAVDQRPAFSIDGREVYFTSARDGTPDIWVSRRQTIHSPWEPPSKLGVINTGAQELHPSLSADGMTLYFASNRAGNQDLYVTRRIRVR